MAMTASKKIDFMVDLETLSNTPNAVVAQYAIAKFDIVTGEISSTVQENICLETEQKNGFEIDASTVSWWLKQSEEARASI